MSKLAIYGVVFASLLLSTSAFVAGDLVNLTTTPGIPQGAFNNFSAYSGYLTLGNGTNMSRSYHYFFVTSMSGKATDPVLLWLNGGPGCSSMAGLLNEIGPWVFGPNGTVLEFNPYSWNANAHVLYIETPLNVGFSYGPASIAFNDTFTAQENDRALRVWFTLYPEYQTNEFYISGESYAGIYLPSLAQTIHWSNVGSSLPRINFKGMAVGNGVVGVDDTILDQSLSLFRFYMRHNLVPPQDMMIFENNCHLNFNQTACYAVVNRTNNYLQNGSPVNPYDIYGYCWNDTGMHLPNGSKFHYARFMNFPGMSKRISLLELNDDPINPFAGLPPCADIVGATLWLNNKDVQTSLHVNNTANPITWTVCYNNSKYTYNGGDFNNMTETYQFLLQQGYRIVYYSGDSDSVCPYDTAEVFFKNLVKTYNLPLTVPKKPWHIPGKYADEPQTTGFYEEYYPNLRFMTFMGVGHMVPQWNRPGGQKMINSFLHQTVLD